MRSKRGLGFRGPEMSYFFIESYAEKFCEMRYPADKSKNIIRAQHREFFPTSPHTSGSIILSHNVVSQVVPGIETQQQT